MPAKPLDFSFKDVKILEELRKMEARSGIRRNIEELTKEDMEKSETLNTKNEKKCR